MDYVSTRNKERKVSAAYAIANGIAQSSAKGKDTRKISIGSVAGQSEHFIKCRGTSGTYCCNGCMYLP